MNSNPYYGIAIVDDDHLFRVIINAQIKKIKASKDVLLFMNGAEAMSYLKTAVKAPGEEPIQIPKLIFLDINMPVMNGWEFLNEFKELSDDIKENIIIYILTSSINDRDEERAKEYSEVSKYVVKPITTADLNGILSEYLNAEKV